MNHAFRGPLVDTATGGSGGGGARLTELGRDLLARYRALETQAAAAVQKELRAFLKLLREPEP